MKTVALAVPAAMPTLIAWMSDKKSVYCWRPSRLDVWIVVVAVTLEGLMLSSVACAQADLPSASISQPAVNDYSADQFQNPDFGSIKGMSNDNRSWFRAAEGRP